jgi:hypothetical protein
MANPGDGNARFEAAGNRVEAQSVEVRIRDDERPALERFGLAAVLCREVGRLPRRIDAEDLFKHQQRADDADDGRGIGDGVGERRQREAIRRNAREHPEGLRRRA